jgi:cation/acetate symporter
MYAAPHRDRERIDGLATFVAAAFVTALGLVAALARVGAPDRVVAALGPLVTVMGLVTLGLVNRTARLGDFLAARRAVPPFYSGMALAATAAGLALAFGGEAVDVFAPWPAAAAGLVGAALIVGPLLRRANASAAADVLATRFPAAPVRLVFALVIFAVGGLTAAAGFAVAVDTLAAAAGLSRRFAEIAIAATLVAGVVPGGLKGLLWSDAASAGAALAVAAIGAALAWNGGGGGGGVAAEWLAIPAEPSDADFLLRSAAAALALAGFLPFAMPSLGAPQGEAQRAGGIGLVLALIAAALGAAASVGFAESEAARSPTATALVGAAAWLPAAALARAGVVTAGRGFGVDLSAAYARFAVLASRRIALSRLAMLAVIGASAVAVDRGFVDAPRALAWALGVNLALITPAVALALAARGGPRSAAVLLATAAVAFAAAIGPGWRTAPPQQILVAALVAGALGLLAGALGALFERRETPSGSMRFDPFADLPFAAPE